MEYSTIYENIRRSFCELTSFKLRNDVLEIITAFSTMNNKFISVFVKIESDKIIVTDNGWIDSNTYSTPMYDESEEIIKKIIMNYSSVYGIKSTSDNQGLQYYYKITNNINSIPSIVFDVAHFILGIVNSFCIQFKDEKEERERETFRSEASDFLKIQYNDHIKFKANLSDIENIKYSAIINKGSNLYLITYITGSTPTYFENDLRKTIVNFEISDKSKYRNIIREKISIINNLSGGYHPNKSSTILSLLSEKTTKEPIDWTEKEKIMEYI